MGTINMAARSCDDRALWDLDARKLDGYAEVEDFGSIGTHETEVDVATNRPTLWNERTAPKKPTTPITRPKPQKPNREVVVPPNTFYTPGVINCLRGSPP